MTGVSVRRDAPARIIAFIQLGQEDLRQGAQVADEPVASSIEVHDAEEA